MTSIITSIIEVFDAITAWIVQAFTDVLPIFITQGVDGAELTVLGVLAICGLAMSIFFLILGIIQKFVRWR